MNTYFKPSRPDGRSDRRVVYELVRTAKPGTTFTYQDLIDVLQPGVGEPIDKNRAQTAARSADRTLGQMEKRRLIVVPGVGYRVMFAKEHVGRATDYQHRAARQIDKALDTLEDTRLDELTDDQRTNHQNKQIRLAGVKVHLDSQKRRRDRVDRVIDSLVQNQQVPGAAPTAAD